jgi:E1A/CREB-binding protein
MVQFFFNMLLTIFFPILKLQTKVVGGCRICKRIWTLLRIHAQKCKEPVCPIPQCMIIREKMRELQKQQQAMDDRRRQEMNRHYGRMSMTSGSG